MNSDYTCHFLNAPPVLSYEKIELLDNGSLHCVTKRAPNTRGLLCCQMSNDSTKKKKNDTALSIRSQRLATTGLAPNCTCPPRTALSVKALNDYITACYSAVLLSKSCRGAPCCHPMVWYFYVIFFTGTRSLVICSWNHISILLHSPCSPPRPGFPPHRRTEPETKGVMAG